MAVSPPRGCPCRGRPIKIEITPLIAKLLCSGVEIAVMMKSMTIEKLGDCLLQQIVRREWSSICIHHPEDRPNEWYFHPEVALAEAVEKLGRALG
jgi:hypothetical protein